MNRHALISALLLALPGCGELSSTHVLERDSLGIRIIDNGAISGGVAYRIGEQKYVVGWNTDDHTWQRVESGVFLEDGRAAIADVGASQVVVLASSGNVESVTGGPGEGPGEFGYLSSVFHAGEDTVVAVDPGIGRATFYHQQRIAREQRLDVAVMQAMVALAYDRGGRLIMTTTRYWPFVDDPWVAAVVARYDLSTATVDTLIRYDLVPRVVQGQTPNPLRPRGWSAANSQSIVTTRGDRTEIERFNRDGQIVQIVRWTEDPLPFHDSIWSAYEHYYRSRQPPSPEVDRVLSNLRGAAEGPLPYSSGLRADDAGNVWVAEYAADVRYPARYRIFSAAGRFQGYVAVPPRFEVLDIAQGLMLGVHRNELDVAAIAVYQLEE